MLFRLDTWQAIWKLLQHGGWVMIAIFAVGQIGWFLICERWWYYHRLRAKSPSRPNGLAQNLESTLTAHRDDGKDGVIAKAREFLAEEAPALNRHLNTVAVLAGTAPLLGLAGTVIGIMETFRSITQYGAGNPSMMAGGIAQALMVTEAGLVVAFPLLLGHNYLQNRADHIEAECVQTATRIIHACEPSPQGGA